MDLKWSMLIFKGVFFSVLLAIVCTLPSAERKPYSLKGNIFHCENMR